MKKLIVILLSLFCCFSFAKITKIKPSTQRMIKTEFFYKLVVEQMQNDLCKEGSVIRECYFLQKQACDKAMVEVSNTCKTTILKNYPNAINLGDKAKAKDFGQAAGKCIGGTLRQKHKSNNSFKCLAAAIKALM